jgi:hypothetical protein
LASTLDASGLRVEAGGGDGNRQAWAQLDELPHPSLWLASI